MPESLQKIRALKAEIDRLGLECDIQVDGGITLETAVLAVEAGANVLVAGTAVFGAEDVPQRVKDFIAL
jgi:ribulose-phosphate 3-epimerase